MNYHDIAEQSTYVMLFQKPGCTGLPAPGTFSILTLTLLQKAVWRPSSPSQSPLSSSVVLGAGMSMSFDRAKQPKACHGPMAI